MVTDLGLTSRKLNKVNIKLQPLNISQFSAYLFTTHSFVLLGEFNNPCCTFIYFTHKMAIYNTKLFTEIFIMTVSTMKETGVHYHNF